MNKYSVGDKVIHSPEGVCFIEDICFLDFEKKQFYKLRSIAEPDKVTYLPVDSKSMKIRPLKSVEEANRILNIEPEDSLLSRYSNVQKRMSGQNLAIREDDSELLIRLIKTYVRKRQFQRISIGDYSWLKEAERFLFSELAEVLNLDFSEIQNKILQKQEHYLPCKAQM